MDAVRYLSQERASFLLTVAGRIVPEITEMGPGGISRFYGIVDEALGDRPAKVRRQFGVFLGVIRWLPLLRLGMPFERLDANRQDRTLQWLQSCRIRLFRQGFWALKTIVFMGYYGQPEVWPSLGYEPRRDGNEALHA